MESRYSIPDSTIGPDALTTEVVQFLEKSSAVMVLHDGCLGPAFVSRLMAVAPSARLLDVRHTRPDVLDGLVRETGLLYACLRDDLGLPFVDRAYARHLQVHPVWYANPRGYVAQNTTAVHSLNEEIAR